MIEWLEQEENLNHLDEPVYALAKIKPHVKIVELGIDGSRLLLNQKHEHWLEFAVMNFYSANGDGSNEAMTCIFHGGGPGGVDSALRECRHTYWGERGDGYLFYPPGPTIIAAFKELSKYFDDMV